MYNVKGPSKIVAKTRRGLVQNIEVKNKKFDKNARHQMDCANNNVIGNELMVKGPKLVFQNSGKRLHHTRTEGNFPDFDAERISTPQHEEIVNYISDSWNGVCSEFDLRTNSSDGSSSPRSDTSVSFYEDDAMATLPDFKPFDLESWWGKRLYTHITNSVNANTTTS